jgi:hypothetical protein
MILIPNMLHVDFLTSSQLGHLSIVRAICRDCFPSLFLTPPLLVLLSLCVDDLVGTYLCYE